MVMLRTTTVVGAFQDQADAVSAIQELRDNGFADHQLGLVAREWVTDAPAPINVRTQHRGGNAAVGGAVAGAAVGTAAVLGLSLVPGLGFIVAGGLLMAALGGAAFGAAAGAFIGPFLALELSEADARRHASDVEIGRTVVVVGTADRQEEARSILLRHGAYDDRMNPSPV